MNKNICSIFITLNCTDDDLRSAHGETAGNLIQMKNILLEYNMLILPKLLNGFRYIKCDEENYEKTLSGDQLNSIVSKYSELGFLMQFTQKTWEQGEVFFRSIALHEFGHIFHDHNLETDYGYRNLKDEIQADNFACDHLSYSDVLNTLGILKDIESTDCFELVERINEIKNMMDLKSIPATR